MVLNHMSVANISIIKFALAASFDKTLAPSFVPLTKSLHPEALPRSYRPVWSCECYNSPGIAHYHMQWCIVVIVQHVYVSACKT